MFQFNRTIVAAGLVATISLLTGCSVNPTTGKRSLDIMSHEQEIAPVP